MEIISSTESPTQTRLPPQEVRTPTINKSVLNREGPSLHLHPPAVVTHRECLKNHAAAIGGHALDGCGEFMPSTVSDPASLHCAACGCHRNFHRRELEDTPSAAALLLPALEYHPLHRHHPQPRPAAGSPGDSPSPPPISSAYFPPHMLIAFSQPPTPEGGVTSLTPGCRRRFRTKFTHKQKEKMLELAERVGWKMQRKDDAFISEFCGKIGVEKVVFKVWMHNNKNTFAKKDHLPTIAPPPPAMENDSPRHRNNSTARY